jgi:HEAT repeat protein
MRIALCVALVLAICTLVMALGIRVAVVLLDSANTPTRDEVDPGPSPRLHPPVARPLIAALTAEDKHTRRRAALVLGRISPAAKEAVPALIAALKDEDEGVRCCAADALGHLGPVAKEAVPALIATLKDEDSQVRRSAAFGLGEIGPAAKGAIPALEAEARDGVHEAKAALKKIRGER